MSEYNDKLTDAVNRCKALNDWAGPADAKLKEICASDTLTPEDRVKEILALQEDARSKQPLVDPLSADYKTLLTGKSL